MSTRFCGSVVCAVILTSAVLGCSNSDEPLTPIVVATFAEPESRKTFAEGSNTFAFDLYSRLREREGNLVVSPVSVATALGMVLAGARGETAEEITAVLQVAGLSRDEAHRAAADLQNDLNGRGEERDFTLSIANRLWAQEDQTILDDFSALIKKHYGADIGRVDFINHPDAAVKQVNAWAARATRDKIPAALDREHVNDLTRLILVNAVYFKARWASPFEEHNTESLDFFRTAEDTVKVPTMYRFGHFRFQHVNGVKALRMPYQGGKLAIMLLLPDEIDGLVQLEQRLASSSFRDWSKVTHQSVSVWLPKFTFTVDLRLNGLLSLMGMPSAFDPQSADFSRIDGIRPIDSNRDEGLFVQDVIQRAFVELDEEGTEAAATTSVTTKKKSEMLTPAAPPAEFRADHPFLFVVHDEETDVILFMGRVTDPTKR
jgi:serpin B